jgi:hypothetical protein
MRKKNPCGALCEEPGGNPEGGNPEGGNADPPRTEPEQDDTRPTRREEGSGRRTVVLPTHAWKSGDVSDGDVTSHTMVYTIGTTTKGMVLIIFHHDPVVWYGADLYLFCMFPGGRC